MHRAPTPMAIKVFFNFLCTLWLKKSFKQNAVSESATLFEKENFTPEHREIKNDPR